MPTYILLSNLTRAGRPDAEVESGTLAEVNQDIEELGAKVLHQWATLGPFDFVNVVEAPDNATIARVSVALGARGERQVPDADARSRSTSSSAPSTTRKALSRRIWPGATSSASASSSSSSPGLGGLDGRLRACRQARQQARDGMGDRDVPRAGVAVPALLHPLLAQDSSTTQLSTASHASSDARIPRLMLVSSGFSTSFVDDRVEHVAVDECVERLDRAAHRAVDLDAELPQLAPRQPLVGDDERERRVPRGGLRQLLLERLDERRRRSRSGVVVAADDVPSRSTIAPKAFTTVKTASFVGPSCRNAPPWPENSPCSSAEGLADGDASGPAPRRPSGKTPSRAARNASRPSSASG